MGEFGSNRAAWLIAGFLGRKFMKVGDFFSLSRASVFYTLNRFGEVFGRARE
ncbi:unnamed protein product [Ectocarpus sp. 13 AM-2016]